MADAAYVIIDPRLGLVLGAISALATVLTAVSLIVWPLAVYIFGGLLAGWGLTMTVLCAIDAAGLRS